MAAVANFNTKRYSWWWDSHNPKNSKWLQDNLTGMSLTEATNFNLNFNCSKNVIFF